MLLELFPKQSAPMKAPSPTEMMQGLLQGLLDGLDAAEMLLDMNPDCLNHVRWVAKEGDPGCCGAAVPVALLEKKVSKLKARILSKRP